MGIVYFYQLEVIKTRFSIIDRQMPVIIGLGEDQWVLKIIPILSLSRH